jgi:hypothetical protein
LVESLPKPKKISEEDVPAAKPIRLQPEGLQMRYRPFGAVGNGEGAADAMDIDEEIPHAEEGTPERKKKRHKSNLEKDKKKKKHKSKGKEVEA